jgi:O-antigen ligase
MLSRINLNQVYQFLFISLAFLFPLTVSGGTVLAVTLIALWVFSGNYRSKFEQIVSNKLSLACIAFFALHLVGLLWTEDLDWGLHMIRKMYWLCLGLPILLTITQEDNRQKYLSAFLLAMTFSEICSYLIWFEVIPPFKHATVANPTPFIDHISYNPLLAFAVYLLLHELLINKGLNTLRRYVYVIFAITMSVNMFITGGRAGHVMYFSVLVIVIFQYFETRKITAFFTALIVIPMVFFSAYQLSPLFKVRTDSAIHTVVHYLEKESRQSGKDSMTENNSAQEIEARFQLLGTSLGDRLTFVVNSYEIFKENWLFGVGTGDFPNEYKRVNKINTPGKVDTVNPHNMYALEAVQFGVLGLFGLLAISYYQFKIALASQDRFIRDVGVALPALFMIIMWAESYLLGHNSTYLFVICSAFVYKNS